MTTMTTEEIIALVNSTVTARLAAASRPWPTVPAVAPLTSDQLVGLATPSNSNKRFDVSQLLGLVQTNWQMTQINHSSSTPLLMTKNAVYNARLASVGPKCGFTLPLKASWNTGDWVMMTGLGSAGWTVGRGDNDAIIYNGGNSATSVSSNNQFDCAFFYCTDPGQINVTWFTQPQVEIADPSNNLYWAPNQFIQNGVATDGSAVITGLGSTSTMYVGMTMLGSTFPVVTILSIDSDTQITVSDTSRYTGAVSLTFLTDRQGSDTAGTGEITAPFATYEKARTRALELGAGQGNPFNLIFLGSSADLGAFKISPYVNIDFNGALFSLDSVTPVGAFEDSNSVIVMQNGYLTSTWDLDTSAFIQSGNSTSGSAVITGLESTESMRAGMPVSSTNFPPAITILSIDSATQITVSDNATATDSSDITFYFGMLQKQILWRNIFAQNGSTYIKHKGNCSEFFCIANDTATNAFTLYVDHIEIENVSPQFEAWIATNETGVTITNTSDDAVVGGYFGKDVYANVSIITTGTQSNTLVTRACIIGGTVTVDGAQAVWQPDALSNKQYTLANGGTIDFSVIQQTLWPMAAATAAPGFVAGPGGSAVLSGVPSLDNFGTFVTNSNYGIAQSAQYTFTYMARISVASAGNFDVDFHLSNVSAPYDNSRVVEQGTVTTAFKMTLCGSVTLDLTEGDQIFLLLKNNGDMDVTVDSATWTIERTY